MSKKFLTAYTSSSVADEDCRSRYWVDWGKKKEGNLPEDWESLKSQFEGKFIPDPDPINLMETVCQFLLISLIVGSIV